MDLACRIGAIGHAFALLVAPMVAGAAGGEASRHLRAAERQAAGYAVLEQHRKSWCDRAAAPADASLAERAVRAAEEAYRTTAGAASPPAPAVLRSLVVQRQCAAYLAARLQPQVRRPVWLVSELTILRVRTGAHPAGAVQAEAVAVNVNGPVVNSRITFAQGLHMSCFGITDARGAVRCTLVDTHPHGPASAGEGDDDAHGGPLIATLAGATSDERIELPAVVQRAMPPHRSAQRTSASR